MSGSIVRLQVSVACSKRQGYRVISGIKTIGDIRSGRKIDDEEKFFAFFEKDFAKGRERVRALSMSPFGIEASYDEAAGKLEIQESFSEIDPRALAELLQALLPRNLPIEFTYTVDGQPGATLVRITRKAITETALPE